MILRRPSFTSPLRITKSTHNEASNCVLLTFRPQRGNDNSCKPNLKNENPKLTFRSNECFTEGPFVLPKGDSLCRRAIRFAEGPTLQTSTSYPLHGGISILINRFHTKSYVNEHGVRFDSVTGNFSRDVYQNYFIISGSTDNVWSVMLY